MDVSKWRAPKGYKTIPEFLSRQIATYPNGKYRYRIVKKQSWCTHISLVTILGISTHKNRQAAEFSAPYSKTWPRSSF
ncbi:MAG: hypothetical protein A2666_01015 [Parcubacteria group bacterium RIFCSPHIGHO2_01_FULL_47_10b]|nr:MAG: hypothetical protein A2666_01015 [Parcubacteria group bacterium RIFCSPHIGHO2_01_FULL_47_10b]